MDIKNLKEIVIEKMRVQWKTISKAFKNMNKNIATDGISPGELRFYLDHWGLKVTPE